MKKVSLSIAAVACCIGCLAGLASAVPDTTWLYPNDSIPTIQAIDLTSATGDTVPRADSGTLFTGSAAPYFNYNYTLTQGTTTGISVQWEQGIVLNDLLTTFSLAGADSLIFYYQGPLSTHTLTAFFVFTDGCGNQTYDSIGILPASAAWARASLPIPASVRTQQEGLVSVNFDINNKAGVTTVTSAPGTLKIDNICAVSANPQSPAAKKSGCGCGSGTGVAMLPPLWFKARSLRRRKMLRKATPPAKSA
jgi:hypothetical protein